jgi:hypothetical protein
MCKDLPGVEMFLAFERMSAHPMPRDVSGTLEVAPRNGPHGHRPVYFFGRQVDDAKVWTSAMFIAFEKLEEHHASVQIGGRPETNRSA